MKKLIRLFNQAMLCAIITSSLSGQDVKDNHYYWYNGKKIPLEINYNQVFVAFDEKIDLNTIAKNLNQDIKIIKSGKAEVEKISKQWGIIEFSNSEITEKDYSNFAVNLKKQNGIKKCRVRNWQEKPYCNVKLFLCEIKKS